MMFLLPISGSEFTRLAQRAREDGLVVYGFGEQRAPGAVRNACSRFIYLEIIVETELSKKVGERPAPPSPIRGKAVKIVARAIEDPDYDDWVNFAVVGSHL